MPSIAALTTLFSNGEVTFRMSTTRFRQQVVAATTKSDQKLILNSFKKTFDLISCGIPQLSP